MLIVKIFFRILLLIVTVLIYGVSLLVSLFLWTGGEFDMADIFNKIFIVLFYLAGLWLVVFEIKLVKDAICEYKK